MWLRLCACLSAFLCAVTSSWAVPYVLGAVVSLWLRLSAMCDCFSLCLLCVSVSVCETMCNTMLPVCN